MGFVVAGLLGLAGAIVIGLAYHNTLADGWRDISAPLDQIKNDSSKKQGPAQ